MASTILGRKIGMTQVFSDRDEIVPVTVIEAGPCVVSQIKTSKTDGYEAIQIGFGSISEKHVNQPMAGHFERAGIEPMRYLREVRVEDTSDYELGQQITCAEFEGCTVDVSGTSKGKGFAGVMRRYGFGGGPGGHGSHFHRAPGSVGQCASPSRIFKGVRMPGHMGSEKVTVRNLSVVSVDEDLNIILVKGAVPGGKGGLVTVRKVK